MRRRANAFADLFDMRILELLSFLIGITLFFKNEKKIIKNL